LYDYSRHDILMMFAKLKFLLSVLSPQQKRAFLKLQLFVTFMAIIELMAIFSIFPFMAVLAEPDIIFEKDILKTIYHYLHFDDVFDFMFFTGLLVLLLILLSNLTRAYVSYKLIYFADGLGCELMCNLHSYFLQKDYFFHIEKNSATLINKVIFQIDRLVDGVIRPMMEINAGLAMVFMITFGIFLVEPLLVLVTLFTLGSFYVVIFKLVRNRLAINGKVITEASKRRIKLMNESLGEIKFLQLSDKKYGYELAFNTASKKFSNSRAMNNTLRSVPRYLLETIAIGGVLTIALYLLRVKGELTEALPILSLCALAGYRLMPALQQIFGSVTTMKGHISALDEVATDLRDLQRIKKQEKQVCTDQGIMFSKHIECLNVYFTYPGANKPALSNVNLTIRANTTVAFAGVSGSGKTTTADVISGLLTPDSGQIFIDDTLLDKNNSNAWQHLIGYVPQSPCLSDASIAKNIAFAMEEDKIDLNKVQMAAKMASLHDFITGLPGGYNTHVGERGVQLSGGQCQRIAIARALYNDPSVLILDEATSALDGITENEIMEAVKNLAHTKTIIIIAHRLSTIQSCDQIFLFNEGHVIAQGSYTDLVQKNTLFERMVNQA
ncbi:MAG: ABC transporter ATP-binding protein/permease, partial [Gammaproteobacteria bacterium]|nr:ABC transporter ATP-binding protein/permease [Gammaproteobacteria bacterium]